MQQSADLFYLRFSHLSKSCPMLVPSERRVHLYPALPSSSQLHAVTHTPDSRSSGGQGRKLASWNPARVDLTRPCLQSQKSFLGSAGVLVHGEHLPSMQESTETSTARIKSKTQKPKGGCGEEQALGVLPRAGVWGNPGSRPGGGQRLWEGGQRARAAGNRVPSVSWVSSSSAS